MFLTRHNINPFSHSPEVCVTIIKSFTLRTSQPSCQTFAAGDESVKKNKKRKKKNHLKNNSTEKCTAQASAAPPST